VAGAERGRNERDGTRRRTRGGEAFDSISSERYVGRNVANCTARITIRFPRNQAACVTLARSPAQRLRPAKFFSWRARRRVHLH